MAAPRAVAPQPAAPPPMRKPVRRFVLHKIMPPIARRGYSALGRSWKYEVENGATLERLVASGQPVVGAFLH